MAIELLKWLNSELKEMEGNLSLEKLLDLQADAKKKIDQQIEQFVNEHELLKRVQVPKKSLKVWKFQIPINVRYLLSVPFIYGMIFPAVIWHVGLEIYHQVCFRLYGIPLVNGQEYFLFDRPLLSQLNWWEKIHCIYCSYVNNLIRYSSEVGGRTERYWCPIKYYRRILHSHSQYDKFVSPADRKSFRKHWEELRDFSDLNK